MSLPSPTHTLGLLFFLLFTGVSESAPKISIHVQLFEIPADFKPPKNIALLSARKGIDSAALPIVFTSSGKTATGSLTREFRQGGKGTFQVGTVLNIRPTLQGSRISYSADVIQTTFEGFAGRSTTQAPIFNVRKTIGIEGSARLGEPVWFDFGGVQEERQTVHESGVPDRVQILRHRYLAVLRFEQN